jgi:hypothetical protein
VFSSEVLILILQAVKCQATSNDRYVDINPIAKYVRPRMGSISIVIRYLIRLIRKHKDYALITALRLEFCRSIIISTHITLAFTVY